MARRSGTPALHTAQDMGFDSGAKLRDECWMMIGERTRARLGELAGNVIDWYATESAAGPDDRPYAVVFGDQGIGIATPRLSTDHRPVYAISAFVFEPGTLRKRRVDHRPQPGPAPVGAPPGPMMGPDLGLDASRRGLLGNLPPRAQELLQAPYTSERRVLRSDWYYEGGRHHLKMFMVYLAGARDVTVATGTKTVPAGHTDATAHWSLTCHRATVARRIGVK